MDIGRGDHGQSFPIGAPFHVTELARVGHIVGDATGCQIHNMHSLEHIAIVDEGSGSQHDHKSVTGGMPGNLRGGSTEFQGFGVGIRFGVIGVHVHNPDFGGLPVFFIDFLIKTFVFDLFRVGLLFVFRQKGDLLAIGAEDRAADGRLMLDELLRLASVNGNDVQRGVLIIASSRYIGDLFSIVAPLHAANVDFAGDEGAGVTGHVYDVQFGIGGAIVFDEELTGNGNRIGHMLTIGRDLGARDYFEFGHMFWLKPLSGSRSNGRQNGQHQQDRQRSQPAFTSVEWKVHASAP